MGFVKYISYEYRRKWLSVFLFYIIDKLYFSRLLCFKVFTQIKDGFISTTVNYYFIYLLWSSTMVGCTDYIVVLLDGYAIF